MSKCVRRRWFVFAATATLAIFLVGCSGGPPGEKPGDPLGAFDFMKARAQLRAMVYCRARYETCDGKPPPDHGGTTAEACLRATVAEWEEIGDGGEEAFGVDPAVLQAIDAGTIAYDADAAESCLATFRDYVQQLSCIQARRLSSLIVRGVVERDLISVCPKVFTPKGEKGDECETTEECEGALVCRREEDDTGGCGRCRPPSGAGTSMTSGFTYARRGESCASPNHTPTCDPTEALLCERAAEGGWTCQAEASKVEGEACRTAGICEPGLTCRDGQCEPFEIAEAGEDCEPKDVHCEQPLICRASGEGGHVCAPVGKNGDACRSDGACIGELWCGPPGRRHDEVGECRGPITEGEDCARGRCAEGLYCTFNYQPKGETCQPKLDEGEECRQQQACKSGLNCRWNRETRMQTCQAPDDEGGAETSIEACRP